MAVKILRSILVVAVAVLLTSLTVVTGVLYQHFGEVQQEQLRDELNLAVNATERLGKSYLEASSSHRYRLTWIAADGDVLYDSHADEGVMENHADREEIREAFAGGAGSSVRRSSTLTEQTIYEAARMEDGSVLRISVSRATVGRLVLDMLPAIVLIAALAIALSVWLAYRMARRIVEPLNRLDLEEPLRNDAYEELSPLLRRVHGQQQEIRQQLEALRRNREEFDQIIRGMKEALVLLDHTGRVISANPAAELLFGPGLLHQGEEFSAAHRRPDVDQAIGRARETGHCQFRERVGERTYQFDVSRIESGGGLHGLVVLAIDVTEQVDAERGRREFSANVSHELKTPLQSIIGSAELLENGMVRPEDIPRFVGHIRREASRLVTLVEDIIRLSQLDEGVEMPREEVSLLALAEEVRETLAEAARAKDITLTVSGEVGRLPGVRRLLFEMIYNLADNAIRYSRPGGTAEITVSDGAGGVCLTVRDSGIGIPPEHQAKVFERFYRVDKSHSRQSGGTGLGLSIVKHAAQYHHGRIDIHSEVDRGTVISIFFERQPAAPL